MDEFELIRRFFDLSYESWGVKVGIGDDGAVLTPTPGMELVNVVDTLVDGVHFPIGTDAGDIAYRAVAVNLSDIAAMGAIPRWMTLALSLPSSDESWLTSFSSGLFEAAADYDVALVGGDTTRADQIVVTVAVSGEVQAGRALLRSGAQPGDKIFVTGTVGDAAGALHLNASNQVDAELMRRFLRPQARVQFGRNLVGIASAAIDVSDGLWSDLEKILDASGVGAQINLEDIPVSTTLRARFPESQVRDFALRGGDDYELCFTVPPGAEPDTSDVRMTAIGTVQDTPGLIAKLNGDVVPYSGSGYCHFT